MIDRDPGKISVPVKSAYLPGSRSRPKLFKCTEIATGISLIKFLKFSFYGIFRFLNKKRRRGGEGEKEQWRGGEEEKRRLGEVERKRKGGEELIGGGRGDLRRK